jgi:hypothetical protein
VAFDKAKFLAPKLETETVEVPGFGPVTVRALTSDEWEGYEAACLVAGADGGKVYRTDRPLLVRMAAVNPDGGENVFTDADLPALRALPLKVLAPVTRAAFRLCGAGEDAEKN